MKDRDKYIKLVEWSENDQCYLGSVPGWLDKCCHGADETKVYKQLCSILDEWIEIYNNDNRPLPTPTAKEYSGKFVLRTGPELHKTLAIKAMQQGESLNNFLVKKLRNVV